MLVAGVDLNPLTLLETLSGVGPGIDAASRAKVGAASWNCRLTGCPRGGGPLRARSAEEKEVCTCVSVESVFLLTQPGRKWSRCGHALVVRL